MIELLARPGSQYLKFSDVARELGLTQATAHAIMKTLSDRGWVSRDPATKMFSLGPGIAAIALGVDAARPLVQAARAGLRGLSQSIGYAASVVERVGNSLVIIAFEDSADMPDVDILGDRFPYAPPFGVAFAAWDTPAGQNAWIARSASTNELLTGRLRHILDRTRDRGFEIDLTTLALAQAAQTLGTLRRDGVPSHVREIMDQLLVEFTAPRLQVDGGSEAEESPVATIAAPVFDRGGQVALSLCVHPGCSLTTRQLDGIGNTLARYAEEIADTASADGGSADGGSC